MDRKMIVLLIVGAIAVGLLTILLIAVFLVDEDGGSQGAPALAPAVRSVSSIR